MRPNETAAQSGFACMEWLDMNIDKSKANRRRILPKISICNMRKAYPNSGPYCWNQWLNVGRYWHGRLIIITCKSWCLKLDFRLDWAADIAETTGPQSWQ